MVRKQMIRVQGSEDCDEGWCQCQSLWEARQASWAREDQDLKGAGTVTAKNMGRFLDLCVKLVQGSLDLKRTRADIWLNLLVSCSRALRLSILATCLRSLSSGRGRTGE